MNIYNPNAPTYALNGTTSLQVIKGSTIEEYFFTEVSIDELMVLRLGTIPGFVLKSEGKYYYTAIPKDLKFTSNKLGIHLCGEFCSTGCKSCKKLDDWNVEFHKRQGYGRVFSILNAGRIEKYDFIPYGYQTFNTEQNAFIVLECLQYQLGRHKSVHLD